MAAAKEQKATGEKANKKVKEKAAEAPAAAAQPAPEPRKPADPRLKYMKKMKGRFLPKGDLRDRHMAILERWNSGEDHGGVTVEELKSLFDAWKVSRQKPAAKA